MSSYRHLLSGRVLLNQVKFNKMKIKNIRIENFRNIIRANVDFGPVNIFTGNNSSGKSNLLLALSNILNTSRDFSNIFSGNIVTHSQGKNRTILETTIDDLKSITVYFEHKDGRQVYFNPKSFKFENVVSKRTLASISHKLFYTGEFSEITLPKDNSYYKPDINKFRESTSFHLIELPELVYGSAFSEEVETTDNKELVVLKEEGGKYRDKYLTIFSNYKDLLVSWISSPSISEYVIKRHKNEVYEQVLNSLLEKDKTKAFRITPFSKSEFIFLLADIQKDSIQRDQFKKDLELYTKGILNDVKINIDGSLGNKGEIIIDSPNAPKDIIHISDGTAIILFFILLKNWLDLKEGLLSYRKPQVMFFDEVVSLIHPSLMPELAELIKAVSKKVQLFISTHSPHFIDCFSRDQVFWLKDYSSNENKPNNSSSIYSYQAIIDKLPKNKDYFSKQKNSELFIEGLLDSVFPNE